MSFLRIAMIGTTSIVTVIDGLAAVLAIFVLHRIVSRKPSSVSYAPGPEGLPLIGNLLDMPMEKEWLTFTKWSELYGNIVSLNILGQRILVINSARVAVDLLEKRGSIYSDRPTSPMGGELVGWKNTLVLLKYGPRFRAGRRMAHQLFGNHATMKKFHPVEELETRRFLKRLLVKPTELDAHIRKTAGAIILRISHGYEIQEENDAFVALAEQATNQFSVSTAPGGFWVNHIPPLRHIPKWVPGAGFQRTAREWAKTLVSMVDMPHDFVKQQMAAGKAPLSFTSSQLEGRHLSAEEDFNVKWLAASLYSGGADTTVAAIYGFFKAMIMFPEVQTKAQAEIDDVVGGDRLPTFEDRDRLPYLHALALEVMRWHAVAPVGVAHRLMEDDIYENCFIPKGTLVLPNVWKMLHDASVYKDPFEFRPERFMGANPEPDPRNVAFGFGRRICPGRVLADASIFISCSMTLAVFQLKKCSENGVTFEPDMEQSTGTISHPSAFKCVITPRSEKAVELIKQND
ncbi:cytochrome P450 [Hymenopellis radicata]|nr:cytochrome P450 [Hymenopellis radicata]